jgi:hypothetical protein
MVAERPIALLPNNSKASATMTSNTDIDCVNYARDCVRLAGMASDPELQERLLQIAREWMAAAMHENKVPKQKSPMVRLVPPSVGVTAHRR